VAVYWTLPARPGEGVNVLFGVAADPDVAADARAAVRRLRTAGLGAGSAAAVQVESAPARASGDAPYEIALSYASDDAGYARDVAGRLTAAGVRVFDYADQQADLWGRDLFAELGRIYGEATYTLVFVSHRYRDKDLDEARVAHGPLQGTAHAPGQRATRASRRRGAL
jgi:hypothetical protein